MIKCNIEPFTDGNSLQLCMKKNTYLHNTQVRINVSILKSMTYYELSMLSLPVYICYAGWLSPRVGTIKVQTSLSYWQRKCDKQYLPS